MFTNRTHIKLSAVLALAAATCFIPTALGQDVKPPADAAKKDVLSVRFTATGETFVRPTAQPISKSTTDAAKPVTEPTPEIVADPKKPIVDPSPAPDDIETDIAAMKAENAAVKEQLRRMEEGQKILIEQLDSLRRRLDRTADGSIAAKPMLTAGSPVTTAKASPDDADATSTAAPLTADPSSPPAAGSTSTADRANSDKTSDRIGKGVTQALTERYREGIIIWETDEDAKVPFMLRFNNNTQFRYLNTMDSDDSFTDHLGVVREVHNRNDLTVNRSMFILGGYIYDKRLKYSLTVWTSAGSASIVVAGNIGWQFNKHLTVTGGYFGVPGSRSLVNTFPYYTATDRSMADNFFRPGFTQGVMANGEIKKGWYYNAFVGNSNNTLSISAAKIDTNLMFAGSTWWEPFGDYAPPGKAGWMYDDYSGEKKLRIRLGTSFTRSREDRFSNLDVASPDNTAIYNSDGVNAFSTGAFALGVTLDKALYKMWAIDWGLKYSGLAINGQYFMRWLGDFEANGPLPLTSTYDHGYEMSVAKFVVPKKLMLYGRGSGVFGEFKNPYEYGGGLKWYFLPTERLWMNIELMKVKGAPYSGAFSPYTAGMNGWVPMVQTIVAF